MSKLKYIHRTDPISRIIPRLRFPEGTGCWEFTGYLSNGYGRIGIDGSGGVDRVHRVMYRRLIGPIPEGQELHHLCDNRSCCNPWHLSPLTRAEHNTKRKNEYFGLLTHCKRGHEFTPENTRHYNGSRHCKTCARIRGSARYEKIRAARQHQEAS